MTVTPDRQFLPSGIWVQMPDGTWVRTPDQPGASGAVQSLNNGGGGGGGGDEVVVQPGTPADPNEYELWIDTDEQPPAATFPPSGAAGGDLSGNYPNPTVKSAAGAMTVAGDLTSDTVTFTRVKNLANNTNLNNVVTSGFYDCYAPTNAPPTITSWVYLEVLHHSNLANAFALQKLHSLTANGSQTWIRRQISGTWDPWRLIVGFNSNPWAIEGREESVTAPGNTTTVSKAISFTANRFSQLPLVWCTVYASTSVFCVTNSMTASGCNLVLFNWDHGNVAAGTYTVYVLILQMAYNSKEG